jgi:hypothetical protein
MDARQLEPAARRQDRSLCQHLKLKFEEFDYGFIYKRVRADPASATGTVGGRAVANGFYLGNHFEWRVPVDGENTLSVAWFFYARPEGAEPYVQDTVPTWVSRSRTSMAAGSRATSSTRHQRLSGNRTPTTQGEYRRASDMGIAIRKRLFDDLDAIAQGQEPQGDHPHPTWPDASAAVLPEGKRRRSRSRITTNGSVAEGAPAGLPGAVMASLGGAAGVRTRHGSRSERRRYQETIAPVQARRPGSG